MTNQVTDETGEDIVRHIAATFQPNATIPQNVANNLLEFLRRVQSTGMEAVAWVECYQYVQQFVSQKTGVPFVGLPPEQPK